MSANTETTGGPPKGYVECRKKCGRWTRVTSPGINDTPACFMCSGFPETSARHDWTPPIAAPAAHIERRKGQRWSWRGRKPHVLAERSSAMYGYAGEWWSTESGERVCFAEDPNGWTLLAAAPPEPEKCESWCGNDLPPDDVCGYGFIDGPGDEREYFKLPGKSQRRKGYVYSWCSNECREKAIAPSAPPSQEAPKAAPALEWSFTDKEGRDHWFATGNERDAASRAYWSWMKEQTGKPYAGPERPPRPQLAADWVEDCLPEGDR